MAWRRNRYRHSIATGSGRTFNIGDFWALRRAKHQGTSVTISLMCDGTKLHKITFPDRGCVILHDHHLRSEKAMLELSDEAKLPRCVRVLNLWKETGGQAYGQFYTHMGSLQFRKVLPIAAWRDHVHSWRSSNRLISDADHMDERLGERLVRTLDKWHTDMEHRIKITYLKQKIERREEFARMAGKLQLGLKRKAKQVQAVQIKQVQAKQVQSAKSTWVLKRS